MHGFFLGFVYVVYFTECSMLHELIEILEKCEDIASKKIKQFHSTNIKYVEQIMDLKTSIKTKEKIIDTLNNGNNFFFNHVLFVIHLH